MRTRLTEVVALILLAGAVLVLVAFGQGWLIMASSGGCSSDDEKLIPALKEQKILAVHPGNVTAVGDPYSGCDRDDEYVYAGISYTFSGPFSDMLSFYSVLASRDGWRPVNESGEASSGVSKESTCFRKQIRGATAYLNLQPSDNQENGPGFSLTISASHGGFPSDGGVAC
ncbi:hypothetical protein [Streptosporangium fragile]|uniref:hypothetical protein n=1 Tax=Streptosporangium fragile TaxID=46186 RepID=UPI0031EDE2F3